MLLIAMDAIMPLMLTKIYTYIDSRAAAIDRKKLKFDADERADLQPMANEVAKFIFGNVSPLTAFLIVTSAMYFNKIDEQLNKK